MRRVDDDPDRFRAIIENQALGISEVDPDENFLFANPAAHRIFGVSQGELVGRNLREFTDEETFRMIRQETEIRRTGKSSTYDVPIIRPDGERRIIRITASPRFDNEGRFMSVLGIYSDVTELKEAELHLRQRERYYRALLRNAADMISILDEELRFRWGSRSTALITGYTEEIYGKPILDYIHPDDLEEAEAELEFLLDNPSVPLHVEHRFRHRDGSYHYHEAILTNLLSDPDVRGIIINSRDVTDRKVMEEKLMASVRELDAFATTVAHDLRIPLSLISGYAQLLQYSDLSVEERRLYLENISKAAQRLDEMTSSLLAYAQAGKPEGTVTDIDPRTIVAEVVEERSVELAARKIRLAVQEEFPTVKADPLKLRQVIANLLDNAVKYTWERVEPRVEIGAHREGEKVTFFVRDNGCGLDPSLAEEIFLPFRRVHEGPSGGLGIGLATVKRTVEGWGGKVWVESRPGEGATFFFTVPSSGA